MDIQTNSWIFQNDATAVGDGKVFKTGRNDQLTVYITGSATFEVLFEGCDGETIPNWFPVPARKFPEMTVVTSTTVTGAYSIDLANFAGIRCRISAIANGALRVTGRAVNVGSGSLTNIPTSIGINNFPTTEFNLITGITTSGTIVSIVDETNNFEEDALIDSWVKFEIDGIKYNRKIISNFMHQINWFTPTREDIGASATIGSGTLGEGQVTISVAEGTGSNYSVEFVAGTGQSSAARADYADGVLTMVSPTDIDSNPTGIMPGNLQGIIEANAEAGAIFTSQTIVSGVALPITFAETLIGADDEITIGSGLPDEGSIVVNCIDSLLGEVGNAYSIEIVQGEAATGDVIASIDENTKAITITVNLNGDSEPIALMAGTLATLIGNDPVFTGKLSPDISTLVAGQIFYTDTPISFEGGLNSIPVPANTEYSITSGIIPMVTQLSGTKLVEQKTQADATENVITFSENLYAVDIYHAEATSQIFTVNGLTLTVPAGGWRTSLGGVVAKTVTIPTSINCIVGRLI